LGSRNVVPVVRSVDSPFEVVEVLSYATSLNSVTLDFSTAPDATSLLASVYLLDLDNSYTETIGDGTNNEFTITHNLNTRDIGVTCRSVASPYDFISVRWEATTLNTAKVIFSSPPTADSRKIGIYTGLGGAKDFNDEITLDMLDDVTVTSASNGQFLSWNGTNWVNSTAPGGAGISSLDDIPGVVITSVEEFQGLSYDGTNWVNGHIPLVSYVRNAEANTITTGTCVYLYSATGDHATVKRADNASDTTSSKTIGVVGANIAASENGPIITRGYVDGIDLSAGYTAGDVLWLGENGAFTTTKPTAPDHLVFIGVVVRATNNGIIYVATQNGYELDELHDVSIVDKTSGDFLKYNGTLWVNDQINLGTDTVGNYVQSLVAGTGITLSNNSGEGATPTITVDTSVIQARVANISDTEIGYLDGVTSAIQTQLNNKANSNTSPVITLSGDLSGSATLTNLGNTTLNATIVANSVALGTDTTGNYMSDISAGTGIAISHTPGEGSTATVSIESTAWTSYTPTITADGGGFALNNGTLTGRYKQVGKTVFFKLKFVFGSTTAAGTGHWNFSLPVTAYDANFTFSAAILDNANAWYGGIGNGNYTGSTSSFAVIIPGTSAAVTTWASVGNGGPFIWGSEDNITITGSYEAA
jgi:hypothetical protein